MCLQLALCFLGCGSTTIAQAVTYSAQIETSQWYLSASIFECSLTHNIPDYGRGVFFHEAGEKLQFYLDALHNPMKPGKAALVLEAPAWKAGLRVKELGFVAVADSARALVVDDVRATDMMDSLLSGMMPTFTRQAWFSDDSVRVRISSINFASLYPDYLKCLSGLLPVNFRQVERSKVHFEVDKAKLTNEDYNVLNNIIIFVKADPTVTAIFVDGHTDSSGRRIHNRRLSKERSEVVTQYLIDHGIREDMITTRYHGERYPVAKNNSKTNKAKNRRTTVRLERGSDAQNNKNGDAEFSDS
ncbi:MAG: OmpA family protein [Hahellaceae bacterium]|nr:OmpA family protein [Hahellaceae bacterium]